VLLQNSGKAFAVFLLCRCSRDDDWNIPAIEDELIQRYMSNIITIAPYVSFTDDNIKPLQTDNSCLSVMRDTVVSKVP
jgi:hypothetical protein